MSTRTQEADTLEDIATTLPLVWPSLNNGNLIPWLRLHELAGVKPPRETIIRFAKTYLDRGHLDEALYAYNLAGEQPEPERLWWYGEKFCTNRPEESARARYLAERLAHEPIRARLRRWYETAVRRLA